MWNFIAAAAPASDALFACYSAQRALRDAIAAHEEAAAALVPLIADSEWHAKGVMALHELLIDLRARTAGEALELENRLYEVQALVAS
ncbi:hypothetical protein [Microbacterium sp.]|jgi:hypothetical protein|uniref:hypothetical protein n=1 Tax=Microbacterium sp. TaxID=51671 RepID=UPI003A90CE6A